MDRATFEKSGLRRLCLTVLWLITAMAVAVVMANITGVLFAESEQQQARAVLLGAVVTPCVLWGLYRLALWKAFGVPADGWRSVILYGLAAFVLCGLFPPWLYTRSGHTERDAGYWFLLTAPKPEGYSNSGIRLDAERLAIEWLCILAATGGLWVLIAKPGRAGRETADLANSDKHAATTPRPATGTPETATSRPTAKIELPTPPPLNGRRARWMTLASVSSLAIIAISLAVWGVHKPKPRHKLPDFDSLVPVEEVRGFKGAAGNGHPAMTAEEFLAGHEPSPVNAGPSAAGKPRIEEFPVVGAGSPAARKPNQIDFISDTEVEITGVGLIYFPSSMSTEQIRDVMRRKIGGVRGNDEIRVKLDMEFTPLKTATNVWLYFPPSRGQ
jgi:hypothetical protein